MKEYKFNPESRELYRGVLLGHVMGIQWSAVEMSNSDRPPVSEIELDRNDIVNVVNNAIHFHAAPTEVFARGLAMALTFRPEHLVADAIDDVNTPAEDLRVAAMAISFHNHNKFARLFNDEISRRDGLTPKQEQQFLKLARQIQNIGKYFDHEQQPGHIETGVISFASDILERLGSQGLSFPEERALKDRRPVLVS